MLAQAVCFSPLNLELTLQLSRPSQTRGSKQKMSAPPVTIPTVASFTDAWIETPDNQQQQSAPNVASFTDAWIETLQMPGGMGFVAGRVLHRRVDRNTGKKAERIREA